MSLRASIRQWQAREQAGTLMDRKEFLGLRSSKYTEPGIQWNSGYNSEINFLTQNIWQF